MKVGIFGGTFDPIHIGHMIMVEQALEMAGLDQVWLIPAPSPPHKQGKSITDARHRLKMTELAVADNPRLRVSRIEMERSGPSYTVDTVKALTRQYPEYQFFLIIGGDMILDLPRWHRIEEILETVEVIGLLRKGIAWNEEKLPDWIKDRLHLFTEGVQLDLSSSLIRKKAAQGQSIRYLVPEPVRRYLEEHTIYEQRSLEKGR
ncbi:nicotinate-nucleotide adenylyltransferase [Marinithermofilum abyssi]|uniref:Probable nicotinate-nucleotide adenylyltransferase n=1 Tax=Marinithermofilum abyssi TaxID=1571185 RepID=A0A8J2YAH6_9BACL|nr:nicotinate-nucleotide adenylyltransferase [Marinithermofilum abyssi]GGE14190.1 nicotinate-nucleotide adenylyltransferase [Marinithermofilum abyssi]